MTAEEIRRMAPKGIILTGGPNSVYDMTSPHGDPAIFDMGIPVLGICYGAQLMAWTLGGKVATARCQRIRKDGSDDSEKKQGFLRMWQTRLSHG